jgi:uncharacterized protein YjbI with pentapeptide repeats
VSFYNADLTGAVFKGAFLKGVSFNHTKLYGVDFESLQKNDVTNTQFSDVSFNGANIEEANFSRAWLRKAQFYNAYGANASFQDTALDSVIFDGANLPTSNFQRAEFIGTSRMKGAQFLKANFRAVLFTSRIEFEGTVFDGADLGGVDFNYQNLRGVSFKGALLVRAQFRSTAHTLAANFDGADLSEAFFYVFDLEGVSLKKTILTNAEFTGNISDQNFSGNLSWLDSRVSQKTALLPKSILKPLTIPQKIKRALKPADGGFEAELLAEQRARFVGLPRAALEKWLQDAKTVEKNIILNVLYRENSFATAKPVELMHRNINIVQLEQYGIKTLEGDHRGADLTAFSGLYCNSVLRGNYQKTIWRQPDFTFCRLEDADFSGADLRGMRLLQATLKNVSFRGADLRGAVIDASILDNVDFTGAQLDGATIVYTEMNRVALKDIKAETLLLDTIVLSQCDADNLILEGKAVGGAGIQLRSLYLSASRVINSRITGNMSLADIEVTAGSWWEVYLDNPAMEQMVVADEGSFAASRMTQTAGQGMTMRDGVHTLFISPAEQQRLQQQGLWCYFAPHIDMKKAGAQTVTVVVDKSLQPQVISSDFKAMQVGYDAAWESGRKKMRQKPLSAAAYSLELFVSSTGDSLLYLPPSARGR